MKEVQLPPCKRTPVWQRITEAAATGTFVLPVCSECETVQYPPREICGNCLADTVEWKNIDSLGKIIGITRLHASTNAFFRENLPVGVVLVRLDAGPRIYAHLGLENAGLNDPVRLLNFIDRSGNGVFVAIATDSDGSEELQRLGPIPA